MPDIANKRSPPTPGPSYRHGPPATTAGLAPPFRCQLSASAVSGHVHGCGCGCGCGEQHVGRAARLSESAQHRVELLVALGDAAVHAAGEDHVAGGEVFDEAQ